MSFLGRDKTHPSFEETKHILRKMACGIKTILSIRNYFPEKILLSLLNALVISHLHYPSILLNGISQNLITTLEKQLSWGVKACFHRKKFESSKDLEIKFQILPIRLFLDLKAVTYFWKWKTNLLSLLNALVISHLHYPSILLNGISQNLITTLEKQLSWGVKACFHRKKFESSKDLEIKFQILPIRLFLDLKAVTYFWKWKTNLLSLLNALVISHLHYPSILLNGISQNLITTLEKQLSWGVKACFHRKEFESSKDLKIKIQILPIRLFLD